MTASARSYIVRLILVLGIRNKAEDASDEVEESVSGSTSIKDS